MTNDKMKAVKDVHNVNIVNNVLIVINITIINPPLTPITPI